MTNPLLKVQEQFLTGQDLIMLYEWCATRLDKECDDSVTGLLMMSNVMLLNTVYEDLMGKLYNERKDPNWTAWLKAEQGVAEKYGDRDNTGNIVHDSMGRAVINEQVIEATKELEALKNGEFKTLWDTVNAGRASNEKLLKDTYKVKVCGTDDLNLKITGATPHIIGILLHDTLLSLTK